MSGDDDFWGQIAKPKSEQSTLTETTTPKPEKQVVTPVEPVTTQTPIDPFAPQTSQEEPKTEIQQPAQQPVGLEQPKAEEKAEEAKPALGIATPVPQAEEPKVEVVAETLQAQVSTDPFGSSTPSPTPSPFAPAPTPAPAQPVSDPFGTSKTPAPSFGGAVASVSAFTPAPAPAVIEAPKVDPFLNKEEVSMYDEFARAKPATGGKNYSFMIFGKKGTSKTSTALGLPGKIFALSYDQQTAIIHEEFFDNDPRIEVWDAIEFFNSKNPETKLESATKTVEYTNWLLEHPCVAFKPDWILIDGTERLTHVCEMAMRAQENLLPYEGVKNRNAWKYRNDLINNIVQRATQLARLGVIYTAYTSIETITTATGEEKREGPKWAGDIEQKTQVVIKTSSHRTQNGRAFVAEVESSKVSFIPTGKRIVVGERLNTGEVQNKVGIKGLFSPEGVKRFFEGGEITQ